MTVTGTCEPHLLGMTLPHEHILIDYGELEGRRSALTHAERTRVQDALHRTQSSGVGTIVDCTPPGYGLNPNLLKELSKATGVNIVISTGSFCEQWAPQPQEVAASSLEALHYRFVREINDGFGRSGIRAGVIKAATSQGYIRANEEKLLRAAARAQRDTNVSIVSHTTGGLGLEQLDIYEQEGADAARILISHVGFEEDPESYSVSIAKYGAFVGLDRIGHHHFFPDDHWIHLIKVLRDAGYLDRVLLSHDSVQRFVGPEEIAGHTFSAPWYLTTAFLPRLREEGFAEQEREMLTVRNARRWLVGEEGSE